MAHLIYRCVVLYIQLTAFLVHCKTKSYREPWGPLMCERRCQQVSGCSALSFDCLNLACYLAKVQHMDRAQVRRLHKTSPDAKCPVHSRFIQSKTKNKQCVIEKQGPKMLKTRAGSLLIASKELKQDETFRMLDIKTKVLERYPYFPANTANAMVYVSTSHTVIFCEQETRHVSSHKLHNHHLSSLRSNLLCTSLAVDKERELLFMIVKYPDIGFAQMTTYGGHLKRLCKKSGRHFQTIAVDPKQAMFYATTKGRLRKGKYSADSADTVLYSDKLKAATLSVDPMTGALYMCGPQSSFMLVPQLNGSRNEEIPAPPRGHILSCHFYRNSLYVVACLNQTVGISAFTEHGYDFLTFIGSLSCNRGPVTICGV